MPLVRIAPFIFLYPIQSYPFAAGQLSHAVIRHLYNL